MTARDRAAYRTLSVVQGYLHGAIDNEHDVDPAKLGRKIEDAFAAYLNVEEESQTVASGGLIPGPSTVDVHKLIASLKTQEHPAPESAHRVAAAEGGSDRSVGAHGAGGTAGGGLEEGGHSSPTVEDPLSFPVQLRCMFCSAKYGIGPTGGVRTPRQVSLLVRDWYMRHSYRCPGQPALGDLAGWKRIDKDGYTGPDS